MNYKAVSYFLGRILMVLGGLMLLPLAVNIYYRANGFYEAGIMSFVIPIAIIEALGVIMSVKKPSNLNIYTKEGFLICGVGWIVVSALGALPFVISGSIPHYIDAFFETVSGFTTTGSTILTDIESLPKSILFWRSFTHWIGGMGILSFMIAIIPRATGNSMYFMKAEAPGPTTGKVVSKIGNSARILYIIYFVMTIAEIAVLFFGTRLTGDDVRFFDCVVTSFSTAGTGGFSVKNSSILGYGSTYVEWVCIVFMFLFGVNFNLYYFLLIKRFSDVYKNEELRAYILINVSASLLIFLNILPSYANAWDAIRDAFFNVNASMSTTGFCTADFNAWPTFSKTILLLMMCFGCSAGSTGGGTKIIRIELIVKQMFANLRQMVRPHSITNVRINKKNVDKKMLKGVNSYYAAYIIVLAFSVLLISLNNFDPATTFTSVLTCLNNVGPGLELVGPTGNFSGFSVFSKLVLSFDMLAGRLELFPILLLFSPSSWKKA